MTGAFVRYVRPAARHQRCSIVHAPDQAFGEDAVTRLVAAGADEYPVSMANCAETPARPSGGEPP
ncbi:hypothetical protein [Streptomyces roseoverticillatus]|uniref:Uncharacterized protein n=1 Tax=Streptomyces roseoverticillatus TaxID=66429 RepID=A0ABV3IX95_9ACTN